MDEEQNNKSRQESRVANCFLGETKGANGREAPKIAPATSVFSLRGWKGGCCRLGLGF